MNKFCLIGIGPHSKKKLIPSINKLPKTKGYLIDIKWLKIVFVFLKCYNIFLKKL